MAYDKKTTNEPTRATHPGKLGDHPLGGAVGAAVGGLAGGAAVAAATGVVTGIATGAATGAAAGVPAGPIGIAAGAGIGGVVGALVGKGIAQEINPTTEDAYWRDQHKTRPYIEKDAAYETYQPAYRHGVEAYTRYEGRAFDEVEPKLRSEWENSDQNATLPWDKAKPASRDAYERLHQQSEIMEDESETVE